MWKTRQRGFQRLAWRTSTRSISKSSLGSLTLRNVFEATHPTCRTNTPFKRSIRLLEGFIAAPRPGTSPYFAPERKRSVHYTALVSSACKDHTGPCVFATMVPIPMLRTFLAPHRPLYILAIGEALI